MSELSVPPEPFAASDRAPSASTVDLARRLLAEGLGTALLLAIVIGSGIMGERLAGGNVALALLGNTLATGAGLVVLVTIFGPVSGAHFNPAVTLVCVVRGEMRANDGAAYALIQIGGAIAGVLLAHAMFGEAAFQVSAKLRDGPGQALSEGIATFGLVLAILGAVRYRSDLVPATVGLYITSAYWFTASTSFANPAVTLARALSDTFAGIAPASVPAFLLAQFTGAAVAAVLGGWLFRKAAP